MAFNVTEQELMAYLYGELEGAEREAVERHLAEHPEARAEMERLKALRSLMSSVKDKEVIAPPLVLGEPPRRRMRELPYVRTVMSIAASLLILMVAGKILGLHVAWSGNQLSIAFGTPVAEQIAPPSSATSSVPASVTQEKVQQMINASLEHNNVAMREGWESTQEKLNASITRNLNLNSEKIDRMMKASSAASQEEIRSFVASMQADNMKLVKNYFQMSATEQKQYIEGLLVDFSKYLQQERTNDLQLVQTQLNSLEKNTDQFKQETEQILTSIITSVGGSAKPIGNRY